MLQEMTERLRRLPSDEPLNVVTSAPSAMLPEFGEVSRQLRAIAPVAARGQPGTTSHDLWPLVRSRLQQAKGPELMREG